jgi:hypothetical protein
MSPMRKSILFFLASLIFSNAIVAQIKAITDKGDEVILYDNGTWKFSKEFMNADSVIKINPASFTRSASASFLLKSNKTHLGFWLDPKIWSFGKATNNKSAEYELQQKGGDIQALLITENIHLTLEALRNIVIKNAKAASPDYHVVKQEYRIVNGLKVLYMEAEGTISDIKFSFLGYYYSDVNTTLQFLVLAVKDGEIDNEKKAEELLNGLVINDAAGTGIPETSVPVMDNAVTVEDAKGDIRAVPQGSMSPNNDCKKYFPGKWHYTTMSQKVTIERTLQKTTEHIGKYFYEYETKWINNCEYQLIFKKTDDPEYKVPKGNEPMIVDIVEIDDNSMQYHISYYGRNINNEMTRDPF